MDICRTCEHYRPQKHEAITNRDEWIASGRTIPRIIEVVEIYPFGKCDEVIIDACNMGYEEMRKQTAKVMTWDGSSYMSGADVTEDFGCIKWTERTNND